MAIVRNNLWLLFLLIPEIVLACPACATAKNEQFLIQTLIAVGIMWLLPVVIAVSIGFKIYQICRSTLKDSKSGI